MPKFFSSTIDNTSAGHRRLVLRRLSSVNRLLIATLLVYGVVFPQATFAKDNGANKHWVGTWSTSQAGPQG